MRSAHKTRASATKEAVRKSPPVAQLPTTPVDRFQVELTGRADELAAILPANVPADKFMAATAIWVRDNPELAEKVDRASLMRAVTQAAEDGLMPDGREGVINVYNMKVKYKDERGTEREKWVQAAKWIPMTFGIRKRAMELQKIIIDAQVIHENDEVRWVQGDNPLFEHIPRLPWKGARGNMVGVYCIFRQVHPSGQIINLHREVMSAEQVERVRAKSKAPNGMLWKDFPEEAWRKTVARRGIKTVPSVHDDLMRVVTRDDDTFDFSGKTIEATVAPMPPPINQQDPLPLPPATNAAPPMPPPTDEPKGDPVDLEREREKNVLRKLLADMRKADNMLALNAAWNRHEKTIESDVSDECKQAAYKMYDAEEARLQKGDEKKPSKKKK